MVEGENFIMMSKVTEVIRLFGKEKAPGLDGVQPWVLQNLLDVTVYLLVLMFRVSLVLG